MKPDIQKIEDLSLNAWPSHQMQVYDGWILRFSYFYTHRTNCVEQIGKPALPLDEKVPYCEAIYRRWGTPCIFKISPVGNPRLDNFLADHGYHIEHHTTVMTRELNMLPVASSLPYRIEIAERVDENWLNSLFSMKMLTDLRHLRVVPQMYAAIPKDEIAVSVHDGDRAIATGLGILDRDTVGVYAIHVDHEYRRKGIASSVVSTILSEAAGRGAAGAYLQVVSDNAAAKQVYSSLGFSERYRYWFRVNDVR